MEQFEKFIRPLLDEINNKMVDWGSPKVIIVSPDLHEIWRQHFVENLKMNNQGILYDIDESNMRITNFIGINVRTSGDLDGHNFEIY